MTYEELDEFFIETLKKILAETKDCKEYVKNLHTPEYVEINRDYDDSIALLEKLISNTKTLDDLAETDEDTITQVYDYIASYADNLLISPDPKQRKLDMKKYDKLEELMSMFLDTEDDYDEDFEEDEE